MVLVLLFQIFAPSATAASFANGPGKQHQEMAPVMVKCPVHSAGNIGKDDARPEPSETHGKCPHCTLSMCCVHAILTSHDLVVAGALLPGTSLIASYSTAYETYFVRGRAGFAIGALHAGPEVLFLGNEEYDAYKLGAFLGGIRLGETSSLTLNAGYTESEGSGSGDGAYAGMSLSFQF